MEFSGSNGRESLHHRTSHRLGRSGTGGRTPLSGRILKTACLLMLIFSAPAVVSAQCPAAEVLVIQVGPMGAGKLTAVNLDSGLSTILTGAFQNAQFVALDGSQTTAFVTDAPSGTLSRVDIATGTIRIVAAGLDSPRGVALSSDESTAFVAEWASGELSAIDLATGAVTPLVTDLPGPIGLALNAGGTAIYVTAGDLFRVDLASGSTVMAAPMPGPGLGMLGLALNISETTAYVTVPNSGQLLAVDLLGGTSRTVATGLNVPFGVVLNAAEDMALVADPFGSRLLAVDLGSGDVIPVASGLSAVGAALNAAGTIAFVSGGLTLSSVNLATGATSVVAAGLISPKGLALDPAERKIFLAEYGHLRVFDRSAQTLATVAGGFSGLRGVALNPPGTVAYVTEQDRLMAVDLLTGTAVPVASGLLYPSGVAIGPSGSTAFVTEEDPDYGDGWLSSVDLVTGTVTRLAAGLAGARAVDLDSSGTGAYVTGRGKLWKVDLPSGAVQTLSANLDPPYGAVSGVALETSGSSALVTEQGSGRLSKVDLSTGEATPVATDLESPVAVVITTPGSYPNHPPVAMPRVQGHAECRSLAGAAVLLDGSASWDPDSSQGTSDDIVSFDWYENFGRSGEVSLGRGESLEAALPLGPHEVTLVVTDRCGRSHLENALTHVEDNTPPVISVASAPNLLWPPNHRMVDVQVSGEAWDECSVPSVVLEAVVSSEPEDAEELGDGNTAQDIQGAAPGSADFGFQVRAERAGEGPGRTYTVVYRATDGSGNVSTSASTILVPHDVGGADEPLTLQVGEGGGGTVLAWSAVPGAVAYDVVRGAVSSLSEAADSFHLGPLTCLASATPLTSTVGSEDPEVPPPGEAFFYLVQYREGLPTGYGTATAAKPRLAAPQQGACQ